MKDRVILHCDCNSFFASVEIALNPALRSVPLAVCGSEENRHGIVLAKNELAKRYGIETAETVYSARKKCPGLVTVEPHYSAYSEYSRAANLIYARYTDMIEPFGIDESWLDVTASSRFGTGEEIAEKIRCEIKEELGITVSIGVSFNKVFAKLGSDYKKPDAITVISRENFREIVYPLEVGSLLFVGRKSREQLHRMGVRTIGDLARTSPELLVARFGKSGRMLSDYARGLDESAVCSASDSDAKSIGNGFTFKHDLVGREECRVGIDYLSEEIGAKLRRRGQKCSTVQLSIKDEFLKVIQRQAPQEPATDISSEIADTAYRLLLDNWSESKPVRMLTVTAMGLIAAECAGEQLDFFGGESEQKRKRDESRENAIDSIRSRFGNLSIIRASVIDNGIGISAPLKKRKNEK